MTPDYARLPAMVQFALIDVEAHTHLARVEQASRMWRTITAELRELSGTLRHEVEQLSQQWTDETGARLVGEVVRCKAAVDDRLARIEAYRPWQALDDLARQLQLAHARVTETTERAAGQAPAEGAVHLADADRYFHAAAHALRGAAGVDDLDGPATSDGCAADCCGSPSAMPGPTLSGVPAADIAGAPAGATTSFSPLAPPPGSALPPGGVAIPGLVAVPPGAGRSPGSSGSAGSPGSSADSPGSSAGSPGSSIGSPGSPAGSADPSGGTELPARIEQVADPVPLTETQARETAPEPPAESSGGTGSGTAAGLPGRMVPPMMMMPMAPGRGRGTARRSGSARSLDETERPARRNPGTPGVPARLRGQAAAASPAGSAVRPVTTPANRPAADSSPGEPLDHEVWQVENPGAATPLRPQP